MKYHLNYTGEPEYGEDHKLTNNWNPNAEYADKEYIKVHFRIETKLYHFNDGFGRYGEDSRERKAEAFYSEAQKALESIGFVVSQSWLGGSCPRAIREKEELYLHPMDFSGDLKKSSVGEVGNALEKVSAEVFKVSWVDLYETVYDMTSREYEDYLRSKEKEIEKMLMEIARTKRSNLYKNIYDVKECVTDKVRLNRVGRPELAGCPGGQTDRFVMDCMESLVNRGYMKKGPWHDDLIRTANKTEMKSLAKIA